MPKKKTLGKEDKDTLLRALQLHERCDGAGIFPTGAGQHVRFKKLSRWGLLDVEGFGFDIDGLHDNEVLVYKLTEDGLEVASILNVGGSTTRIERILAGAGKS